MARHRSEAEQRGELAAWKQSGLSAEVFARGRGYAPSSLTRWQLRHASSRRAEGVAFARLVVGASPGRAGAELTLAIGPVRVAVRRGFDAELLREVIAAVTTEGAS
jgi:hypothetical protein